MGQNAGKYIGNYKEKFHKETVTNVHQWFCMAGISDAAWDVFRTMDSCVEQTDWYFTSPESWEMLPSMVQEKETWLQGIATFFWCFQSAYMLFPLLLLNKYKVTITLASI